MILPALLTLALVVTAIGWWRAESDAFGVSNGRFEACRWEQSTLVLDWTSGAGQVASPHVDARSADRVVVSLGSAKKPAPIPRSDCPGHCGWSCTADRWKSEIRMGIQSSAPSPANLPRRGKSGHRWLVPALGLRWARQLEEVTPELRDFRDSPWFYPAMFDLAVLLPAALTLASDQEMPSWLRIFAPGCFIAINATAWVLIRRRRYESRHSSPTGSNLPARVGAMRGRGRPA